MINIFKQKSGFGSSIFTRQTIPNEIKDSIIQIDEETYQKLLDHKIMWKEVAHKVEKPIYEQKEVGVEEVEIDDLEKPILNENEEVIGYEKKIENRPIYESVDTGKVEIVEVKNCELVENPDYENYLKEIEKEKQYEEYRKELFDIQAWFKENDWKPNKIITGEWLETDPRWIEYKQERAVKRARQDYLNILLQ